ncbi:hypothetical protein [Methylobacterium nigriterrae]
MNQDYILAFIILPIVIAGLGWTAAFLHMREARRQQQSPGE